MRKRTHSREIALQVLYQHDLGRRLKECPEATPEDFSSFVDGASDDPLVKEYARWLIDGTISTLKTLDERIGAVAKNWKLTRIAAVDRCVLRIALFELLKSTEVPPKVAINEAIDLAKKYSGEQSGAFVNGILDRIYNDLEGEPDAEEVVRKEGD